MGNTDMKNGPKAPKDPTKKRPALYLMLDDVIEGRLREDGNYAEISSHHLNKMQLSSSPSYTL